MIYAALVVLHERADSGVADAQELPLADESFDVVLASHMLYHVPDRPQAFTEIRRVLVPGGRLHAATNGAGYLDELGALYEAPFHEHLEAFGLESGPPQMPAFFADVEVDRFEGELRVTEVEPVLAYIRSSFVYRGQPLDGAAETVSTASTREGAFRIRTCAGVISCRRP